MSVPYSADEVFEIALQVERNAASFYRRAAQVAEDESLRQKLQELAAMEVEHEKIFAQMREELSRQEREPTQPDPWGEAILYLRGVADGRVFHVKTDPATWLMGKVSKVDILRAAIGQEKDSIVFYLGLKELVPDRLGKERIDGMIKEEMNHVAALSAELEAARD